MDNSLAGRARRAAVLAAVALVISGAAAAQGASAGDPAVVKTDAVAVHTAASNRSPVVAWLTRGTAVSIDLTMTGPDGEWCRVTNDVAVMLGFVRCTTLDRVPTPRSARGSADAMKQVPGAPVAGKLAIVSITLEQRQPAFMLIDTGASATIITPVMLRVLGLSIPPDAPRRELTVVGGRKIEAPFVRLSSLGLGTTVVRDVEVGVYDVVPQAPVVDGVLGGDILQRFRSTLDAGARQLRLVPLRTRGTRE